MFNKKQLILGFMLLSCSNCWADAPVAAVTPAMPVYPPVNNAPALRLTEINAGTVTNTNATGFALQAGAIGGVAQACGQNIAVYLSRVNEALDRLALSSTDKSLAMASLQKALQNSQLAQAQNHPFSCQQALQDFNSLPLMRDDYRQTVLSQLSPSMGAATPPTTVPQGNPPGNLATGPSPGATVGNVLPNINSTVPAGAPPPPAFPSPITASQAPNINDQAPSVGPAVDTTKPAPNINEIAPNSLSDMNPPNSVTNPYAGNYPAGNTPPPVNPYSP